MIWRLKKKKGVFVGNVVEKLLFSTAVKKQEACYNLVRFLSFFFFPFYCISCDACIRNRLLSC